MFSLFKSTRTERLEAIVLILSRKIYGVRKSSDKSDAILEFLEGTITKDELEEKLSAKYTDKE